MGLYAVLAHAHYVVALRREGRIIVPEAAGLRRALRRVVLGVKVDDGFLPRFDEVLRGNRIPILVQHLKGGHFISYLLHTLFFSAKLGIFPGNGKGGLPVRPSP